MKNLFAIIMLIGLPMSGMAETRTLTTVDFKLPLGIAEKIPRSVKKQDIFVSDDFCFYVRKDLSFVWIGCVG